ncbi:dihydrouridine synthase [Rozella allomycis CSF55]|uniref:tRNA-dihydrouridine(16/17) synthase [NAD(P)(+)] n=1 Tax=Rozella allomycis (strain CSF55) TaxID=988480 RepID=A0A4P9YID8_ROZAC|nr:dihydrouridine synthase [Rozella allomycis CSF55]
MTQDFLSIIESAKNVLAPMVDQSELAWRILSRKYGADLCYTPMINAKIYADSKNKKYKETIFSTNEKDRPLIIQFCGNDPELILKAALDLQDKCDAVDINLGCPQGIAKKGHYGAYLQDEWPLIESIVSLLKANLKVPVTCKIRIFPELEKTIAYAKMLEKAGCSLLTVHGRTREQNKDRSGLADWEVIKAIKENVSIPVFANGNIIYNEDIDKCIELTGVDGVMSAEGNLYNPGIFLKDCHPFIPDVIDEYLEICQTTPTPPTCIKGHLFKLLRPCINKYTELRDELATCTNDFTQIANKFRIVLEKDREAASNSTARSDNEFEVDENGYKIIPHWLCQPYFRDKTLGNKERRPKRNPEVIEEETKCKKQKKELEE